MRTFIAIELDPMLREPLVKLLRKDLPRDRDVRWCAENQLHVTLKFLGELDDEQLAGVREVVRNVCAQVEPFSIHLGALGCFPNPRAARVLWCGLEDETGGCRRWVELADPLLAELGFERETRAFTPHITLGRSKAPGGAQVFQRVLGSVTPPTAGTMRVGQVVVFESRLLPSGAEYRPVFTAALGGTQSTLPPGV